MKQEKKYLDGTRIEDLRGMKFGKWSVIEFDVDRYNKAKDRNNRQVKHYWKCICDCNNTGSIDRYTLVSGKSIMCKTCSVEIGSKKLREKAKYKYTFEQWCKDNNHQDYLDLWDYDLNNDKPNEITYSCNGKYYFKCSRGLHESKLAGINKLSHDRGLTCDKCNSFGQYLLDTYGEYGVDIYWSDKNNMSPFSISRGSDKCKVWIKCENNVHEDYEIRPDAFHVVQGCVRCTRERKESYLQEKVRSYITHIGYEVLNEHECSIVPINPKTNRNLPFDNEIVGLNILCEVNGKQHYERANWHLTAAKRNKTDPDYEFHKRKLYDRYKRYIAYKHGYEVLEIPYWTEDDESYKDLINNKIEEMLNNRKKEVVK